MVMMCEVENCIHLIKCTDTFSWSPTICELPTEAFTDEERTAHPKEKCQHYKNNIYKTEW